MDCMQAQSVISDAIDRMPVDADVLAAAKDHCRSCAECGGFVRALTVVKRAPLPAPPDSLVDRVMADVRTEAARQAAEREALALAAANAEAEAAAASPVSAEDSDASYADTVEPFAEPPARLPRMSRRTVLAAWSAAAVIFVAAVIFGTVASIRSMSAPPPVASSAITAEKTAIAPNASDQTYGGAAAPSASGAAPTAPSAEATSPSFITVSGEVYSLTGSETSVTAAQLSNGGQTVSSLDGTTRSTLTVLRGTDPNRVFVSPTPGTLLAFDRVTRQYAGKTYKLLSADIAKFGVWPTLPGTMTPPSNPDGSPTFTKVGPDGSGTIVYRLSSGTADEGIAVAPGSPSNDPAAGDPNWTWWVRMQ